jgi:hypothetical protein
MKAALKIPLYAALAAVGLVGVAFVAFWLWMRWEYHLPSDEAARQQFVRHQADYVRFASLLQREPGAKMIGGNGDVDPYTSRARHEPEYADLIHKIGAKSVRVREDGSIEFELWGFGCAPCRDSFKGIRYFSPSSQSQATVGWPPKPVTSLDDANLPKDRGAVADGLYVVPLGGDWSIYRLEID